MITAKKKADFAKILRRRNYVLHMSDGNGTWIETFDLTRKQYATLKSYATKVLGMKPTGQPVDR